VPLADRVQPRRVRIVARREFAATVTRLGYVATLFLMPLLMGAVAVLPAVGIALSGGEESMLGLKKASDVSVVVVVDETAEGVVEPRWIAWHNEDQAQAVAERRLLPERDRPPEMNLPGPLAARAATAQRDWGGFDEGARILLKTAESSDAARALVRAGEAESAWIIGADWVEHGVAPVFIPELAPLNPGIYPGRLAVARLLRRSIAKDIPEGWQTARLLQVLEPDETEVGREGEEPRAQAGNQDAMERGLQNLLPILFASFFAMTVFVASGYLLDGIGEEKENRVLEVLLASLTPEELLLGKMIGLGAAGLLQSGFFALVGLGPLIALDLISISPWALLGMATCSLLGYALYASLMAASGAIAGNRQEGRQISAVWTLTAASPMFILPVFMSQPDGTVATALSLFPLTAPIAMTLRLGVEGAPAWQIGLCFTLMAATAWLAWIGGSRIFRVGILMTGARPPLRTVLRWLRDA